MEKEKKTNLIVNQKSKCKDCKKGRDGAFNKITINNRKPQILELQLPKNYLPLIQI